MRNQDIVERFEKDFERCKSQCGHLQKSYVADKEFFLLDKQWSEAEINARNPKGQAPRPTLTINRMRQFLMKVINDHKQARMGIKVRPAGDEDKDLAEVRQGIIRALEKNNGGRGAYNQAKEDQVAAGFGAWRLYADYMSPTSFEQEPKFLPIYDCSKLYWPVSDCMEADYSDMDCAIIQEDWSKDRFKRKFKTDPDTFLKASKNPTGCWGAENAPTVSEYYFKNEISDTLVRSALDGKEILLSDLKAQAEEMGIDADSLCMLDEQGERIERETTRCEIWWAKLAGKQVIGKPIKLPGQWIPVFIANGRKVVLNGKTELWSLGRPAKDSQRSHNYAASAEIERLALSPKAPFVVARGSIPQAEKSKWETLNTGNWPYVQFDAYDPNTKQPLPPPHRTDPVQTDAGFANLKMGTVDEMKATIGIYDASIGQRSNETSGVAIESRKREGDTATFDFSDNFAITMRHCGRVINEWIPEYIDTPRQVRMVGEDDAEKVVRVNEMAQGEDGKPYHYPMTEGQFDIDIDMGPSASTKRQEAVQSMQEFYQTFPPAAAITGHLFAKELDWKYSDEFSTLLKRFAASQYPGVIEPDEKDGQQPPTPEMMQMHAQMQQMAQQLQEAQKAAQEAQALKMDRSIEAARLQIEKFKADTDRMKVQADMQVKQGQMLLAADDQQHDQTIENAKLIHEANAHAHQRKQDEKKFGQAESKMHLDHAAKVSQLGKRPTGAHPGQSPSSTAQN